MIPLRVLLAEDSEDDELLIMGELRAGGYELRHTRVEAADDLERALAEHTWDIVISDYSMPQFTALDALAIVRRSLPDLPFLIVSGSIGEESAVAALKAGASNYLMKSNLRGLLPMVERELKDAQMRRERAEAFTALERAVRARDEFLSIASHELKTPLTSLRLQTQSVLRSAHRDTGRVIDNAQVLRKLEVIDRNAGRLVVLIERLLDINRVASGRLELARDDVDLVQLVRSMLDSMADVFRDAECVVTLIAPDSLVGHWDRDRLESIVENLVSNAVKYGPGRPIRIEIDDVVDKAKLHVIDHGIGISAEDQSRIFGRFERAVPEKHYGGFGVGLWLAQQIVEAHGGTIEVVSNTGSGSTFTVTLPKRDPA